MRAFIERTRGFGRLCALLLAAACHEEPRTRPNVLVLCVDTLRGDRLGFQGYGRETSPNLDALAARGTRFRQAYSTYPQTSPAVASLFTGLYPSAHRKTREASATLALELTTLAEAFAHAGYRTGSVATNPHLSPGLGYEQGFEHYVYVQGTKPSGRAGQGRSEEVALPGTTVERRTSETAYYGRGDAANQAALEWLDGLTGPEPFLLYVHYMDVHSPYVSPAPYQEMFVEGPGTDRYCNGVPPRPVRPEDLAYTGSLYDGGVRYLDTLVAELLSALEARARLADTVVVLVADHGDEFLEHGGFGHGNTLYRELLHVPLVFAGPGVEARDVHTPVSLVDVLPTLCELAGVAAPGRAQGQSLRAFLSGLDGPRAELLAECASTRLDLGAGANGRNRRMPRGPAGRTDAHEPALALLADGWHLIHGLTSGKSELYRPVDDPREQHDLAAAHPEEVARLLQRARALSEGSELLGRAVQPATHELDDETRADLEGLGYAGEEE
jgi:arylsulfatase